jgi:hypothetical protein
MYNNNKSRALVIMIEPHQMFGYGNTENLVVKKVGLQSRWHDRAVGIHIVENVYDQQCVMNTGDHYGI